MSMMCTMQTCKAKKGFCGHEKMMMGLLVLAMVGGVGHFALNWF